MCRADVTRRKRLTNATSCLRVRFAWAAAELRSEPPAKGASDARRNAIGS